MRTRITIILVAANLALFGLLFFLDRKAGADQLMREASRKVLGAEAADLDYLEIEIAATGDKRVLQRGGNANWHIRSPIDWPANPFAVNRLLQQLEFLERDTSFRVSDLARRGQTLAHYGLEEPGIILRFGRGDRRHELKIGETTEIGNRLYVLAPGGEWIHVVPRELAETLSLGLADLRSETVFHIPLFELRSLNLHLGETRVRLSGSGGEWRFETPFQTRADRSAVEAAVQRLNTLKIDGFIDPAGQLSAYGLENPAMRITLEGNNRRETLLVGGPVARGNQPLVYGKLENNATVFTLPADPLYALEKAQDLLRDRRLVRLDRDRLSSLNITGSGGADILLQKLEPNQWQVVSRFPDQSLRILPADPALVERMIESVDQTHVVRFANDAPSDSDLDRYGLGTPARRIVFGGDDTPALLIGNHVPDTGGLEVFSKLEGSRFVYTVDASLLRELPLTTSYYRDRLLLRQPDGALLTSIRISDAEDDRKIYEIALSSPSSGWEEALADRPDGERRAVMALLPELRNLRVQRFVQDGFSSSFNLDNQTITFPYRLVAELLLVGGDTARQSELRLHLSEKLGGQTVFAGSPELNVIFTPRQSLIDALTPLLFERSAPPSPDAPPDP